MSRQQLPVVLMILDGWGISQQTEGNAIAQGHTPNMDRLWAQYGHSQLFCSGEYVGLPEGQQGNSEVGHLNLGAGRVVYQELTRINQAVREHTLQENQAFQQVMDDCIKQQKPLHLMGLVSPGGVHSHSSHLYGLLEMAAAKGLTQVYVHCFLDGRDVGPSTGLGFIEELEAHLKQIGVGKIATVSGRYYAMDRDNRWERVEKAYRAMTAGEGQQAASAAEAVQQSYDKGQTDEFVVPVVCDKDGCIRENDSVIFFNFRPDRAREITRTLVDPDFAGFERRNGFFPLYFVCMTQYDAAMPNVHVAFKPQSLANTFGQYISDHGLTQLRIAETEKYAHVTFFFNGGVEAPCKNEDRALIASPKVATYDLKPEMSAYEVTDELLARLDSGKYDVVILNFANCDMVGHTGVFEAAVSAVEAVDTCLGKVVDKILSMGGRALITADHGNADQMYEPDGSPFTAHTTNPVPLLLVGDGTHTLKEGGRLADLAPTMLEMLGLPQPAEMDGKSLLTK